MFSLILSLTVEMDFTRASIFIAALETPFADSYTAFITCSFITWISFAVFLDDSANCLISSATTAK